MKTEKLKSVKSIKSVKIRLFSPQEILQESFGEVKTPETINYRTQRAERDGLFCEKIFGPEKDFRCYCGKYKGIKYKGIVCDRCGVEVTNSRVRRERMGHISLASPVLHIWFLKIVPSTISLLLNVSEFDLEKVVYFAGYIIEEVDEARKKEIEKEIEKEFKEKVERLKKEISDKNVLKEEIEKLTQLKNKTKAELKQIVPLRVLNEIEFRDLALKYGDCFKAGTGAEALKRIVEKINLDEEIKKMEKEITKEEDLETKKKILLRLRLFKWLKRGQMRPEWMFLENLLVLPPDLRPIIELEEARFASSDLNELYKRIINRNNRLKELMAIGAPEVILRNEKRLLQEAVDALLDNTLRKSITTKASTGGKRLLKSLADILKGKEGRFRLNLLGKRVDYSGRSVIIVGPDLKMDQVGIPKRMALEIFKPFVIKNLLQKGIAFNVKAASRIIEEEREEAFAALEEEIKDKVVLINRAPTLHRLSIQAFYPVLIEGKAIKIHPLICEPFNADFDGDQMGVFLPLSSLSQKESKERILSSKNLLKPANGELCLSLGQEISLGIHLLTKILPGEKGEGKVFSSFEEAKLAEELGFISLNAKIKVKYQGEFIETCVGRIIFNEVFEGILPFQNKHIKDKGELKKLLFEVFQKAGEEKLKEVLDKIKEIAFEKGTLYGVSFGIEDLKHPLEKEKIIEKAKEEEEKLKKSFEKGWLSAEEFKAKKTEIWLDVVFKLGKLVPQTLGQENPVSQLIESKAKGSWHQVNQMCALKGLVSSPSGEIIDLPILHSYAEGLTPLEYFCSSHGARKGSTDKALRTSFAGYLTRRLVDACHDVIVRVKDCQDEEGFEIDLKEAEEIGQKPEMKIVGRVLAQDLKSGKKILAKKNQVIDWDLAKKIVEQKIEKVRVFSPITCKARHGVCQKCYGWDLGKNQMVKLGEAVGIVAAQSIGEPGTQLTMRTFHLGGVATAEDITQGLPRVEEIFEATSPKMKAGISPVEGKVVEVGEWKIKILDESTQKEVEIQRPQGVHCFVKKGEKVKKGQVLFEGNLDPKEVFKYQGKLACVKYMLKEVQKVYCQNGVSIHDKHFEIVFRQMFSRVKIVDPGDSTFLLGEVVEKWRLEKENEILRKEKKKEAKGKEILLGITKVALTYSSFLSAASFQETARVLVRAALEQAEDNLLGLKENVILGKLLPIGDEFKVEN